MSYFRELLHGRPPSSIAIGPQSINSDLFDTTLTYFIVYILVPTEVVGYHLTAAYGSGDIFEQVPSDETECRFWLSNSNTDNGLPYRVMPNSDTGRNTVDGSGNPTYAARLDAFSGHWYDPYSDLQNSDFAYDILLVNPCRIDTPGMYWVAFLYQSSGGGEFHSSIVTGATRGVKDLHYSGTTPTNAQSVLYNHWSSQPDKLPERLNYGNVEAFDAEFYPNITISLITQQLTPKVPYGG